ncbi:hypothetical protein LINPERHAP2_LOCUS35213, partial [Linum perenne]
YIAGRAWFSRFSPFQSRTFSQTSLETSIKSGRTLGLITKKSLFQKKNRLHECKKTRETILDLVESPPIAERPKTGSFQGSGGWGVYSNNNGSLDTSVSTNDG